MCHNWDLWDQLVQVSTFHSWFKHGELLTPSFWVKKNVCWHMTESFPNNDIMFDHHRRHSMEVWTSNKASTSMFRVSFTWHKPFVDKKGRIEQELLDTNLALLKIQRIKLQVIAIVWQLGTIHYSPLTFIMNLSWWSLCSHVWLFVKFLSEEAC